MPSRSCTLRERNQLQITNITQRPPSLYPKHTQNTQTCSHTCNVCCMYTHTDRLRNISQSFCCTYRTSFTSCWYKFVQSVSHCIDSPPLNCLHHTATAAAKFPFLLYESPAAEDADSVHGSHPHSVLHLCGAE